MHKGVFGEIDKSQKEKPGSQQENLLRSRLCLMQ